MSRYSQLPPILLVHALKLRLCGRIHFQKDCIGNIEKGESEDFVIFRKVIVDPAEDQLLKPGAIFKVSFQFARFSSVTNRFLSLIPIPFIVAQSGFRSKIWMLGNKTGTFQGVYEWDTVEDARKYWDSFPLKLMRKRAITETLTHEIITL